MAPGASRPRRRSGGKSCRIRRRADSRDEARDWPPAPILARGLNSSVIPVCADWADAAVANAREKPQNRLGSQATLFALSGGRGLGRDCVRLLTSLLADRIRRGISHATVLVSPPGPRHRIRPTAPPDEQRPSPRTT